MNQKCAESMEKYRFLRSVTAPILESYFILACNLPLLEDAPMPGRETSKLKVHNNHNSYRIYLEIYLTFSHQIFCPKSRGLTCARITIFHVTEFLNFSQHCDLSLKQFLNVIM